MTQRQPKGSKNGGQFAPDSRGKTPPSPGFVAASPPPSTSAPTATVDLAHEAFERATTATNAAPAPFANRNGYQFAPEGECSYCDEMYDSRQSFFPPHRRERSRNCGGGSNFHHCTCSACF